MESKSTKSNVESRLHQTAEAMSDRLASLQGEVSSTGDSLQKWIVENPLKSVGGMLAAGLAVGLLFGGGSSSRRSNHSDLLDTYLNALRDEVEQAVSRGEEPGPALEEALRDRVPLVVYSPEERNRNGGETDRGFLREGANILFTTGLSLFAREVLSSLLDSLDVEGIVDEQIVD